MACMSVFALAAPEDALLFTDPKDPSVIAVMPVGDTLYILARQQNADTQLYEEALYAYTLGTSAAPELVCDDFCYTRHYLTQAQVPCGGQRAVCGWLWLPVQRRRKSLRLQ